MVEHVKECERYIEIIEDETVDKLIRDRALFYFLKVVNIHPYKSAVKEALRHLVKNCCNSKELPPHSINKFASDFKSNGFTMTACFFIASYNFKGVRFFIEFLYGGYNNYRVRRHKNKMNLLQKTIYKPYFDDIVNIQVRPSLIQPD